jgi:hypothetical protein
MECCAELRVGTRWEALPGLPHLVVAEWCMGGGDGGVSHMAQLECAQGMLLWVDGIQYSCRLQRHPLSHAARLSGKTPSQPEYRRSPVSVRGSRLSF